MSMRDYNMSVIVIFCACLFILIGAVAQQRSTPDSGTVTVRGCLKRSRQNYIVVDPQGHVYALKPVVDTANGDVGHEVEVKGKLTNNINVVMSPHKLSSDPSGTVRTVDVIQQALSISGNIRKLSEHCSAH